METNIFSILRLHYHEIRHSNFLSGLFDYKKDNQLVLGGFLSEFLLELKNRDLIDEFFFRSFSESKNIFIDPEHDLKDLAPELSGRIDILLYSEDKELLICIENKVKSKEHSNQLSKYYDYINSNFKNYRKCFLYLTLFGDKPSHESWHQISYKFDILPLIKSFISKEANPKLKVYLEDYRDILDSLTAGKKIKGGNIENKLFNEIATRLDNLGFRDIKKKGKTGLLFMPVELDFIPHKNSRKLNRQGNFSSNGCDDRNISFDVVFTQSKKLYFRITLLKADFDLKESLNDIEKSNLKESQIFYKKIESVFISSGLSLNKKSGGSFGYWHIEQQLLYKNFDIIIDSLTEKRFEELVLDIIEKVMTIYNRESTKKIIKLLQDNKDYLLS